jgi:uncharacterized protein YdgA (DUF945 family)
MNTLTKVGAAVAIVAVGWAAGTVVSGQRVQAKLESQGPLGEPLEGGLFKVVNSEYRKSFLGAKRTLSVEIGCAQDDKPAPRLIVQQDIQHGPFPGFSSVGAARISTKLVLDAEARARLKEAIGTEDLPLEIVTLAGFGGSSRTDVTSAGFSASDAKAGMQVTLKPLAISLDAGASGETSLRYDVQGYELKDNRGMTMVLTGVKGTAKGMAPHWYAMGTEGEGQVERLEMRMPQAGDKPAFLLTNMKAVSTGSIENDMYNAKSSVTGQAEVMGHKLEDFTMKASLKNLKASAYAKLVTNLMQPKLGCDKPGEPAAAAAQRQVAQMQDDMLALLPSNPELSLDELSVKLEGQKALLSYAIGTQGMSAEDAKAGFSPALMGKIKLNALLETSTGFLQAVAKLANQPHQMVDGMVAQGVEKGFLKQEGNTIRAVFALDKGQALLNGQPVPLPGLPAPAPAPEPEVAPQ